jgi:hypothetical protein
MLSLPCRCPVIAGGTVMCPGPDSSYPGAQGAGSGTVLQQRCRSLLMSLLPVTGCHRRQCRGVDCPTGSKQRVWYTRLMEQGWGLLDSLSGAACRFTGGVPRSLRIYVTQ